jgi:hypothetical protein
MNISRRTAMFILCASILLLLGTLFWPFMVNEIITPLSLLAWLFLRIFVLSIGQQYYWGAIIIFVGFILFRLLFQEPTIVPSNVSEDSNATIKMIANWRTLFAPTDQDVRDDVYLKRELRRLLLSLYASNQGASDKLEVYEALQQGEIPLPKSIHDFLFLEQPNKTGRSLQALTLSIWKTPQKWIRRWTGQETADHYRMIDEVLRFMETSLEMKNDDGKFNSNQH